MKFKYKILLIIAPLVFIIDQVTKMWIRSNLDFGESISVVPGYFDIVHISNKGAAFGMLSSASESFRVPFFYFIAALAVIFIIVSLIKISVKERLMPIILSLILGGIFGNIIDRIRFGEVTDFLSFHIKNKIASFAVFGNNISFRLEWPSFNVADSAITIAMILLVIAIFKKPESKKEAV